jgi:hypothetical protein
MALTSGREGRDDPRGVARERNSDLGLYVIWCIAWLMAIAVVLVRARRRPVWSVVAAGAAGLALVALVWLALSWAGIDLDRLNLLLAVASASCLVAAAAVVGGIFRRRRGHRRSRSPFDLS